MSNELDRFAFEPAQCAACLQNDTAWWTTVDAPTQWTCGDPALNSATIVFGAGNASEPSAACRCHYSDLAPPPPPPCPYGSYDACLEACANQPPPIDPCVAECKLLCPH